GATRTRVLPPEGEAAGHEVLVGVKIPAEGLLLGSELLEVEKPAEGCRVLLWGEAVDSGGKSVGERQPVLWVREVARTARGKGGAEVELPPQRIAVTTLGTGADFQSPEFRVIAVQMVAWA